MTFASFWRKMLNGNKNQPLPKLHAAERVTIKHRAAEGKMAEQKAAGPSIFVAIASYCDADCAATLSDLFAKAKYPDRIMVGVCWQYKPGEQPESCPVP
jgi:hypothetical protein